MKIQGPYSTIKTLCFRILILEQDKLNKPLALSIANFTELCEFVSQIDNSTMNFKAII